ncbi:MFS-type transporter SLC18B1-like [Watersipora subatra]|uniref:MFS-type transporter SLC18B1-like n=1 Tax=Watersipora subatra TaxID=2589382 RepID=UPI00355C39CA
MSSDQELKPLVLKETEKARDNDIAEPKPDRKYAMLITLLFLQFVSRAADTMIYPFYPDKALSEGLNMADVGVVYAAYDISRFITSPLFGSILLKWPPKSMCIVGTAITGITSVAFGYMERLESRDWFLAMCVILRALAGTGSAMISIASTSILLKASGFQSNTIIGLAEVVTGFSFAFGAALGGFLYESPP